VYIRLLGAAIVLFLFSLALGCGGGSSTPPPTTTSSPTGPTSPTTPPALALGSVTVANPVSCANENGADQGAPNGTCYDLTISCLTSPTKPWE